MWMIVISVLTIIARQLVLCEEKIKTNLSQGNLAIALLLNNNFTNITLNQCVIKV